ncbi:MAG: TonB-dependent receptor [Terracidiphilus sp.]|nr:TonB-dependent receptor [Terracidiphilus sp.]
MKTTFSWLLRTGLLALLFTLPVAWTQSVTGAITGAVTDPSGAVVVGAQVTAQNIGTGVESKTATNAAGIYHINFLPIGRYQVKVKAAGFNEVTVPAFQLEVLQTATFNVQLSVGTTQTTIDVTAAAPILNTENSTLGTTLTSNSIGNMPLNGLDFSSMTLYVPGAVNTAGTSGMQNFGRNTYYTDTPNMNGNRAQANNYTLDGIDMNESFNNLIAYSPAPEALEEIKVLTANSPADYGNVNGGGIISILKSGTNEFHGSVYGYVQDYHMNANSWTNNNQNIGLNPFSQSQFGGAIGGPILRNKLFFFADYLGSRWHKGGWGSASVIPHAMRSGDFSVLLAQGTPTQLFDPLNNFAKFSGNTGLSVVNPVAKYLFSHPEIYPDCGSANPSTPANGKCVTPTDGIGNSNYQAHSRSYKANDQGDIKIEYDMNAANKFTGFFSKGEAYDGSTPVLAITFPGVNDYPTWIVGTSWNHTFSPSLVNLARIGFTRTIWAQSVPLDKTGTFGTKGNSVVGINYADQAYAGFSYQGIGDYGVGTPAYDGGLTDNTYTYIDNLTWQRGLHYLSMGVQATRYENNYPTSNNYGFLGQMGYSGNFTSNDAYSGNSGYSVADFILDRVSSLQVTLGSVNVGQRQWRAAGFINDDWKLLPNLTINLGMRWEFDQPWYEVNNKTGNIDIATGQVIYANAVPSGAAAGAGVCSNRACYNANFRQWMPRFGFSWQANDRLVVRGGYGASSFFEGNSSNQRLTSMTPFISAINVSVNKPSAVHSTVTTPYKAENGFNGATSYGGTFNVYPKNIQPAYIQEWSLTTEYALTRTLSLQVGYLGEKGDHIEDYGNLNQWTKPNDATSAPYYSNKYIGINAPAAVSIGSNSLLVTESRAMMNFNALEATLRQRAHNGLEYTLNYTYGKAMTNSLGNYSLGVSGYSGAFQNYYDSGADYGPAGYDIKHNISGMAVYALPIGRNQLYLGRINRWLDEAVGGWKLSAAGVSYSGFPETLTTSSSSNTQSYGNERANQYRAMHVHQRNIYHWFGTDTSAQPCTAAGADNGQCAFGAPANNTFGSSRNGAVRGPGYLNVDMSAFKDFAIVGTHKVGFRFDAFNAFNVASYGNPDTNINSSTFGAIAQVNSIRSQERHLQFSVHYAF